MINWNIFENNLLNYISNRRAKNIEDIAKFISDNYDNLIKTGTNIYKHRIINANKNILKSNLENAFNYGRNQKTNNIGQLISKAFLMYWQTAQISADIPPPGAISVLSNKIINFGSPLNIIINNSNNPNLFVKNLVNNLKIHIKTISGVTIAIVPVGTVLTPTPFNWTGIN